MDKKKNDNKFTVGLDNEAMDVIHRLYKNTFKKLAKIEKEEQRRKDLDLEKKNFKKKKK
ncbi:hypothetical protein [Fictibacillus phosphorivorans]|uniref:hypothetical protein n=1 Tax=Fictibacillus phosphorivorans TaxID=1221500 RepID=UPI001293F9FE|nr:hypothetical protein [Fictibacillus phosphorivorans]